ncbi:unnamed protein product [Cuscuta europaea]|uniref:Pectinesterase inhibitor domain-containing protein n=1 Tax=Cuscuta europaea TaxID=41803 RepID=A0A9P0ZGH2_CUSEU|nr:unnamed protein product [Cuscuta europaea]
MGLGNKFLAAFLASLALSIFSINPSSEAARVNSAVIGTTNSEFIKSSCQSTTYPHLCYTSLSSHASEIGADPELLARTALTVAVQGARSTSTCLVKMAAQSYNITRREAGAMHDCVEEMRDSVDQIRKSMEEMKELSGPRFEIIMSDVETWVSAALTDQDTCMDGFAGKALDGSLKAAVKLQIRKVAHLTSNALALINNFASSHH